MRKIAISIIVLTVITFNSFAQELNCIVNVIPTQDIKQTDSKVFETMQTAIYEFMNSRKWTNYTYALEERIECTILITINNRSNDVYTATLQVQSRRPIYKTSYNSVMLNLYDKEFKFNYVESQPLDFNENSYTSNLTSVLGFYANIIIGFDFDSFSLKGGTPMFDKAQTILTNASTSGDGGWLSSGHKNRYWLIENLRNNIYSALRECNYNYHRKGLDGMVDNAAASKNIITVSLEQLKKLNEEKPNSYLMSLFFIAKADEIVNLYSTGSVTEKTKIANICKAIDPTNSSKYNQITK